MKVFYTGEVKSFSSKKEIEEIEKIENVLFVQIEIEKKRKVDIKVTSTSILPSKDDEPLKILSIVDFLSRESGDIWTDDFENKMILRIKTQSDNIKKSMQIKMLPYTTPLEADEQKKRGVISGEITPERLSKIAKNIEELKTPKKGLTGSNIIRKIDIETNARRKINKKIDFSILDKIRKYE